MLTEKDVLSALEDVLVPGVQRSVNGLNLVQGIDINAGKVIVTMASTALDAEALNWVSQKSADTIRRLEMQPESEVVFVDKRPAELNHIKNVIAVMSGKGGVGKSLVTALTCLQLNRKGFSVGILDADITGPSIPKMFGIKVRPRGSESGILPVTSANGIELISINLFLPDDDDAVIWRGPMIGKAITQFWEDVVWGNLDYLVVDLPPGTADAPLTALQVLPVNGVIVVFTPQDLTTMIVRKAVKMAQQMDKKVIGVVENMSYLHVPELKKNIEIFGKSRGAEMARASSATLLARIPIDPKLASLCDDGNVEKYDGAILQSYGEALLKVLPADEK